MRLRFKVMAGAIMAACAVPAVAQLDLPPLPVPPVAGVLDKATGTARDLAEPVLSDARELANARLTRIGELVRRNRKAIELDLTGEPARRGELLLIDPTAGQLSQVEAAGFKLLGREDIAELGFAVVRVAVPAGLSLPAAQRQLQALLPDGEVSADLLHFQAGEAVRKADGVAKAGGASISIPVGMIDGAPGPWFSARATRGFAAGAPLPSNHGSAIASLLAGAGVSRVLVADVYGSDPAGGNALALARGLAWLVGQGVKAVTISLVGPSSPVVARAIASAQARGVVIVAAVGNDGPAAPPSYPASYPGVIAVSAVDGRNRALIEAGRALHLDYVAPGADVTASDAKGRGLRVRGTSYATPLVAARAAAAIAASGSSRAAVLDRLDREAQDLGKPGPDPWFGRGLLCSGCRRIR